MSNNKIEAQQALFSFVLSMDCLISLFQNMTFYAQIHSERDFIGVSLSKKFDHDDYRSELMMFHKLLNLARHCISAKNYKILSCSAITFWRSFTASWED